MNIRIPFLLLCFALLISACRTTKLPATVTAFIVEEGLLTCFPANTTLNGATVWCEASAVAFDGRNVLLANDKDMPATLSPVFTKTIATLSDSTQSPTYLMPTAYVTGRKYEDFAQTPDRRFVLLSTGFDRIKTGSTDWDGYNTILYWRTGDEQHPHVLTLGDSGATSVSLRPKLARALAGGEFPDGPPYYKVEGLAATDKLLLFGIREVGKAYDSFKSVDKVIAVTYSVANDRIQLADDWRVVADFDPARAAPDLPRPLSLSSLEYDPYTKRFWLLTSLETPQQLDAYLWSISPADLLADKPFTLVRTPNGRPLRFGHKAEDLTPVGRNRLLIIHDDDRVQTTVKGRVRQPNQAAFTIVQLGSSRQAASTERTRRYPE